MKFIFAIAILSLVIVGCKEEKIRTYTEKPASMAPQPPTDQKDMPKMPAGHPPIDQNSPSMGAAPQGAPTRTANDTRPKFSWKLPKGWLVQEGGGMITATYFPDDGTNSFKATLIILGGMAGGVDANLERWLGQIGLPSDPGTIAKVKNGATQVAGVNVKGSLYDLTLQATQEKTFLVTILPVEEYSVFVKFMAAPDVAKAQKQNFTALLNSLEYTANGN
ncbi:MAG: hypothetical protein OCC49_14460 [Fibrobacterales bacterium]